jgi:hypothetical protein
LLILPNNSILPVIFFNAILSRFSFVLVVLFSGKKIPELAKCIGKGIRELNDAKDGVKKEIEQGMRK